MQRFDVSRTKRVVSIGAGLLLLAACTNNGGVTANGGGQTQVSQQSDNAACRLFGPKTVSYGLGGGVAGAGAGAAIGALAGQNLKSALIGAGAGLVTGLVAGGALGHNLDQRDCLAAQEALRQFEKAPSNVPVSWSSPTGDHGTFTPIGTSFTNAQGQICRRERSSFMGNGQQATDEEGVICRTDNGDWVRVSS